VGKPRWASGVATKRDHPRKRAEPGGSERRPWRGLAVHREITQFFTDPAHKQFTEGSDTRNARFRATVVRQALDASVIRELG
jgi:hypothetical protein